MRHRRNADRASIEVRVQGVCFSEAQLLCVCHRKSDASYWVLPGGHLERGESLWDGLVREFVEETGLRLESGVLWAVSEFRSVDRQVVECAFRVTSFDGQPRLGTDLDGSTSGTLIDLRWVERSAFAALDFRPSIIGRHLRAHWDDPVIPPAYLGVEVV